MKALARNTFLFLLALLSVTACEKDEDKIYLNSIEPGQLVASDDAVVLTQDRSADIVLSLAWSVDNLAVSDPSAGVPGGLMSMSLEASTDEQFSTAVSTAVTSYSQAYTGSSLNALAQNAGVEPYSPTPVYFRLAARTGSNMEPVYTNTVAVTITSYEIDMSHLYVLDNSQAETGMSLYSPQSDGHYEGFLGVSGWYNFFLREGDGRIWGAAPIDDNPFTLSEAENKWNLWFPEPSGCYYVVADVNELYWTALSIPALTLTGDIAGTPEFDRTNNRWTLRFQAAEAGTATIRLSATGSLYNSSTATKDEAAVSTAVSFAQEGDAVVLADQPGDISVSIPAAGECTLILDLSDPTHWTASVQSGGTGEETANPLIYLPGVDDLTSGGWTFDNYLRLYDAATLSYAGAAAVNSEWGYQIALEVDNWNDIYTLGEGDAYAGTLVFGAGNNLPAPEPGLYFMNVSLGALTYSLTPVQEVACCGFNDNWDLQSMTASDTPGVYMTTVEITAETPWGFQIILNGDWNLSLGGGNGILVYQGVDDVSNIPFSGENGTYLLTVDLVQATYTMTLQ
ncbi:MAG TPA: DUF5114 domain-containing protein [Candidatus Bacteroides merdipullorum]|uniref:DUF5114 domain-containing protein n=1 Tax=Candidatus Bacteroides merdipullorum TaxID=2838474 RepID=A0A9D2A3F0_9BACE|nr:DUF5114 domain-containing protein [Candidatus Bacteroides merdipullorum]